MLDVWAEAQWFSIFQPLAAGCTVLIISHRLTTTMQADVIHVMQGGRIIESGAHTGLQSQNGRYRGLGMDRRGSVGRPDSFLITWQ